MSLWTSTRVLNLSCFNTIWNFTLISWDVRVEMSQTSFAFRQPFAVKVKATKSDAKCLRQMVSTSRIQTVSTRHFPAPKCPYGTEISPHDTLQCSYRLVGLVVKTSASRVEDPGFEFHLRRDFSGVESYQWLKNWYSSGYPVRRLAL